MTKIRSIGLKAIYLGAVAAIGGMPAALTSPGKTFKGTASFNTEANSEQDFYSEEEPSAPEESVSTEAGLATLKWNLMEWDNAELVRLFGGTTKTENVTVDTKTYSVEKYSAPSDIVNVELGVRAISRYNAVIDIPRAKIQARFVWNLTQTDIAQIEITAKVLAPVVDTESPYHIYKLGEPTV